MTTEPVTTEPTWRKATRSDGSGNCVEVAFFEDGTIGVRDSKDHGRGPVLRFAPDQWDTLLETLADGQFQRP
ncbi:DUF397 domain-containing protein [Nocardia sp. IFM 10818]